MLPVSVIGLSVLVSVLSFAIGSVLSPNTFIDLSFHVQKPTLAFSTAKRPVYFINGAIRPDQLAKPVPKSLEPRSFVNSS
jgi:hypothetical protein